VLNADSAVCVKLCLSIAYIIGVTSLQKVNYQLELSSVRREQQATYSYKRKRKRKLMQSAIYVVVVGVVGVTVVVVIGAVRQV
jgi:hypothetical protein